MPDRPEAAPIGHGRVSDFSLRKRYAINDADSRSTDKLTLPWIVDQDWLDRLCTLQVLADHGDLDARDTLREWCAHDREAHCAWTRLTATCREVRSADEC